MHWGVRRYQNADGTLTNAGRTHRQDLEARAHRKKVAKKVAITAATVVGLYATHRLINSPKAIGLGKKAVSSVLSSSKSVGKAIGGTTEGKAIKFVGNKVGKVLSRAGLNFVRNLPKAGNAMANAAVASVGAIGISILAEKLAVDDSMPKSKKYLNKITFDSTSAGIATATNASFSGKSGNKSNKTSDNGAVANRLYDSRNSIIGSPSSEGIDKSSRSYSDLFSGQDSDTRTVIKKLANDGYSISQIRQFLEQVDKTEVKHSIYSTVLPVYIGTCPVDLLF